MGLVRGHTVELSGNTDPRTQVSDGLSNALMSVGVPFPLPTPIMGHKLLKSGNIVARLVWPKGLCTRLARPPVQGAHGGSASHTRTTKLEDE